MSVCGTASASDILTLDEMGIDPWGELQDIQEQQAENSADPALDSFAEGEIMQVARADVALAAAAVDADPWVMYWNSSAVYFGVSSSRRKSFAGYQGSFSVAPQMHLLSSYTISSRFASVYYNATSAYTVDIMTACSYSSDTDTELKFIGSVGFNLTVAQSASSNYGFTLYPNSVQLLINGQPYGDAQDINTAFNLSVPLEGSYSQITSYGFRFAYPLYTKAQNVDNEDDEVCLWCWFDPSAFSVGSVDPTVGLLNGIIGMIQNVINAIVALPGNIANAILNGLQSLFVPSQEDFTNLKTQYETLLEERLGFIWQAGEWVVTFGQSILTAVQGGNEYTFTFPGISFPMNGTTYVLAEPVQVSLQNAFFDVVRPVLGTIVAMVCVVAFVHTAEDMVTAVVSGATYFEFLKGRREDDN